MRTAKAVAAGMAGFLAPAAALLITQHGHMSGPDWLVAAATCVVVYGATYAAPKNKP